MAYLAGEMADVVAFERLCYIQFENKASAGIPAITTATYDTNYSSFLSYDSTSKKFTALADFDALIIPWVYSYSKAGASAPEGEFYINDVKVVPRYYTSLLSGTNGGYPFLIHISTNDTMWVYTPSANGYPSQRLKIYRVHIPTNNLADVLNFTDEKA
jgi:hypothetical protein